MDNFDPYNVLLAIATNIPVLLMTALVLQGTLYSEHYVYEVNEWFELKLWVLRQIRLRLEPQDSEIYWILAPIVCQRCCPAAFWEPEAPALCRRVEVWKRGPTIPWCRAGHVSAPVFVVLAMKMRITPQAKLVKSEYYITYLSAARAVCL